MNIDFIEMENQVLGNLLKSTDAIKAVLERKIPVEYFKRQDSRTLYKMILYKFEAYGGLLEADSFELLRKEASSSTDLMQQTHILYAQVGTLPLNNCFPLVLDNFIRSITSQMVIQTVEKITILERENRSEEAFSEMAKVIAQHQQVKQADDSDCGFMGADSTNFISRLRDKILHPEKFRGVLTGYEEFDKTTNGFLKGTFTIIMGTYKSGKSVLGLNLAYNMAVLHGKKVLYHVNEGGKEMIDERFVCRGSGVMLDHIMKGKDLAGNVLLTEEEVVKCEDFYKKPNATNIYIQSVVPAASSAASLDAKLSQLAMLGTPVDIAFVDHLGLMTTDARYENRSEKVGEITKELIAVARKHQIPIIALTHVNKDGIKSKGEAYNAEDMGLSIEPLKHADMITSWKIQEEEAFKKGNRGHGIWAIQQNRRGPTVSVTLRVDTNFMIIENAGVAFTQPDTTAPATDPAATAPTTTPTPPTPPTEQV